MIRFEFHEPASLEEVVALLDHYGEEAAVLAGGTALLIDMRHGERQPGHLISLWGTPQLAGLRWNGGLGIGALTTVRQMADELESVQPMRGLVEAARLLGGLQVQNVATVGGNLCKASPGADLAPPLLVLDATLRLRGPGGERTTPLEGFLTGPDRTDLRPAEVLTEIEVPELPPQTGTSFLKVMRRHAVDCSIVAVAACVSLAEDGETASQVRIALGAAAPAPFRAKRAEELLTGAILKPSLAREAARLARDEARPISDVRASAEYRQMLVEALVERAVLLAAERAKAAQERQ
ncbi:MAG TPA: xanthine dehydrogenase family protein subunit M [Anaerolineales bacterium]|nr:xanthine dehydrogenase family protein subunit M [Anaerolineales bacterium]